MVQQIMERAIEMGFSDDDYSEVMAAGADSEEHGRESHEPEACGVVGVGTSRAWVGQEGDLASGSWRSGRGEEGLGEAAVFLASVGIGEIVGCRHPGEVLWVQKSQDELRQPIRRPYWQPLITIMVSRARAKRRSSNVKSYATRIR
jgi:hypothetical protein